MNICFLIRAMERGGAEQQLTNLACGFQKQGQQVTVLTFYPGGELENDLRAAGVNVQCLGKSSRWQILGTLIALVRYIRSIRPDVLHAYMPTANILAVLAKPFIGEVCVVTGVRASDIDLAHYGQLTAWSYRVDRFMSRFADGIISNSHAGASIYKKSNTRTPIHIIPNGIDVDRFKPDPNLRAAIRVVWGINGLAPVIGMVARIDPMKDYDSFLSAVAIINAQRTDIRFVCVARTNMPAGKALVDQAARLGISDCLIWAGPFDNMQAIYLGFDALVLTSVCGEGFPNVVAEAMACGVPCVVTNVGDAAMVVGDTGFSVPLRSPDVLANRLLELVAKIEHSQAAVSQATRLRVVDHFSVDALVQQSLKIIKDITESRCVKLPD